MTGRRKAAKAKAGGRPGDMDRCGVSVEYEVEGKIECVSRSSVTEILF